MKRFIFVVMVAIGLGLVVQPSFAGTLNSLPFTDDFESYANGTPLIDGINGWYASSPKAVVQSDIVKTGGTKAVIIPNNVTLSSRFENLGTTNVWIQLDLRPVRYGETDTPEVDPEATSMFYVNRDGYFIVHDGSSASFVTITNTAAGASAIRIPDNKWVRVHVYQDYSKKTWTLFTDRALMKENIGFINTDATRFNGFDIQNGGVDATYIDNVAVSANYPEELRASNWLPDLMVGSKD